MSSFRQVFYVVVSWPVHVRHPAARLGMKIESAWDTHAEAVKRQGQIVDGPAEGEYSHENPLGDSNVEVMTYVDLHTRGLNPKKFGNWLHPLGGARPGGLGAAPGKTKHSWEFDFNIHHYRGFSTVGGSGKFNTETLERFRSWVPRRGNSRFREDPQEDGSTIVGWHYQGSHARSSVNLVAKLLKDMGFTVEDSE